MQIPVSHHAAGRLENELRSAGYVMAETSYEPSETILRIALPDGANAIADAGERLASMTAGASALRLRGTDWVDVPG